MINTITPFAFEVDIAKNKLRVSEALYTFFRRKEVLSENYEIQAYKKNQNLVYFEAKDFNALISYQQYFSQSFRQIFGVDVDEFCKVADDSSAFYINLEKLVPYILENSYIEPPIEF